MVSMGDFQQFGEDDEGKNDHAEKNGQRLTPSRNHETPGNGGFCELGGDLRQSLFQSYGVKAGA